MKIEHMFITAVTKRGSRALALLFGLAMMICALLLLLGLQSATKPAQAASTPFTVNSTGDENDLDFPGGTFDGSSDGLCDVDSSTAGEQCTLRAAIQQANVTKGADTIAFDIPGGGGVKTISPGSQLPTITKRVTIDGYTQSGATENTVPLAKDGTNALLMIELDGSLAGPAATGLLLKGADASNSVIRGLVINRFTFYGIFLFSGTGYKVEGNFIGTDPSGTTPESNAPGGVIIQASSSTLGGTSPDKRNLISGNRNGGIFIFDRANKIEGNLIGTNKDGTNAPNSPVGNEGEGVLVFNSPSNTIGDSDPSDGLTNAANIIAFNASHGVAISGDTATGNRILSNSIFSNVKQPFPPTFRGLGIDLQGGTENSDKITANDGLDKDTGPNRLQNYPDITSAQTSQTLTRITGMLESTPSTRHKKRTFIIQFFSNSSGFPEGQTFLGETQVSTDRQGNASISFVPAQKVPVGESITATATNKKTGDTSEFSNAREVEPPVIEP